MKKLAFWHILVGLITMGITFYYTIDIVDGDFINIITLIIGSLILILTIGSTLHYTNQIKNTKEEGKLFPYSWDGIGKYDNPIPKGWAISFLASMVFVMYYILIAYPTWSFSQIGQYNEEVLAYNDRYEKKWKNIANDKEELIKMGESIFLVQCSTCHGVLSDGLNGKSRDLVKWSSEDFITHVILNGASGNLAYSGGMPGGMAGAEDAKAISAYVASEFMANHSTKNPALVTKGKEAYGVSCSGCHGMDGKGMEYVAPSLHSLVVDVLNNGKKGAIGSMPAFTNFNSIQKKALNSYIYSLNN